MQRRQFLRNLFGIATTGALIAGPVEYARMAEAEMRNFRVFQVEVEIHAWHFEYPLRVFRVLLSFKMFGSD